MSHQERPRSRRGARPMKRCVVPGRFIGPMNLSKQSMRGVSPELSRVGAIEQSAFECAAGTASVPDHRNSDHRQSGPRPVQRLSYVTNSVKLEDKDKNLKRRMCREFVEKCRPGGPTYCNDAPLTNAGTPKRFASISYPLETRWSGNPAPGLGGDSVVVNQIHARSRAPHQTIFPGGPHAPNSRRRRSR
ncbi:hypothetical protein SCOR_35480 [Sulfidibacter corallicola]